MKKVKSIQILIIILVCSFSIHFIYSIVRYNDQFNLSLYKENNEEFKSLKSSSINPEIFWNYTTTTGSWIFDVAISSDGKYIAATGIYDNKVYFFDNSKTAPIWIYNASDGMTWIDMSSDGSYFVVGSSDHKIHLFNKTSPIPIWIYTTGAEILSVAISTDGNYIIAGSEDRNMYFFEKSNPTPIWIFHSYNNMKINRVSMSSDGFYFVAIDDWGGTLYLFNRASSEPIWTYDTTTTLTSVSISSDGFYLATGDEDGNLYFFNRTSSSPMWSYDTGIISRINCIKLSSDGSIITAGCTDHRLYVFNKLSSNPIWNYTVGGTFGPNGLAISSDSKYIAASNTWTFPNIFFFEKSSSNPLWDYTDNENGIKGLAMTPDAKYIVFGTSYGEIYQLRINLLINISINNPLTYELFGKSTPQFNVNISGLAIDTTWYSLNGGLNYTFSGSSGTIEQEAWDACGNGTVTIRFYANNSAGNTNFGDVIVYKDIIIPEINIISPIPYELFGNTTITFELSIVEPNLDKAWYSLNGGLNYTFSGSSGTIEQEAWDACGNGTVTIRFYANDTAGNTNFKDVIVYKDIIIPEINIISPIPYELFGNTTITFELSIVEPNLDKAWYSLNGGLNYTFSGSSGTIEQEAWDACGNGTVTIRFYANNSAGNTAFKEAIIRKDIISPIWDFLPENQIIEFGDDLVYNVFALDSSGIHHWWINNSYDFIISNDGSITNALNLILGEYWLEIRAYDPCGNFCSASIKIIVQEVANPLQIPGYNLILLLGFIFTVVIYIYFKQGKARTSRNYIF